MKMNKNFKNLREEIKKANKRLRKVHEISKEQKAEEILQKGLRKIKRTEKKLKELAEQGVYTGINADGFVLPVSVAEVKLFAGKDEKYLNYLGMKISEDGENIILI